MLLEEFIHGAFERIEKRLDKQDVALEQILGHEHRIRRMEDRFALATKIFGGVITAVVTAIALIRLGLSR